MIKYYEHYSLRLVKCQYLFLRTLLIFIDPEDPNLLHADCSGSENLDFHVHRVGGGHQIRFVEETYAALSIRSSRLMHGFFLSSDDSYAWVIYSFVYAPDIRRTFERLHWFNSNLVCWYTIWVTIYWFLTELWAFLFTWCFLSQWRDLIVWLI